MTPPTTDTPTPQPPTASAPAPDWSREACRGLWDPPRRLMASIRGYQRWRAARGPVGVLLGWALWRWHILAHRFWSVVCAADIPVNCRLGGGLLLVHPNGIVIHPDSVVGPNCLLMHQVTLGVGGKIPGTPMLGGHVDVGAGAKILGGVVIGDRARIGANAVVLQDVPAGATAVGVPARIIVKPDAPADSAG
jgi:serine O-acetyltransferase